MSKTTREADAAPKNPPTRMPPPSAAFPRDAVGWRWPTLCAALAQKLRCRLPGGREPDAVSAPSGATQPD